MKKLFATLALAGAAAGIIGGVLAKNHVAREVKADAPTTTLGKVSYVAVDDLFDLTGIDVGIRAKDFTYWGDGLSTFALDNYLSTGYFKDTSKDEQAHGYNNEGWTGTVSSKTWLQTTKYVYFQFGGADNSNTDNPTKLVFHYGNQSVDVWNDTFCEGHMLLRYIEIPDEVITANPDGFVMSVDIVDLRGGGWGLVNFGYLHPNATRDSVGDAMRYYLNHMNINDCSDVKHTWRKKVYHHYFSNSSLKSIFLEAEADLKEINEDFETSATFVNDWYFDHDYFNNVGGTYYVDEAASKGTARPGNDTKMPFNQTDNGLFRGWHESDGGFVAADAPIYRFVTRPFVLPSSGTGLVSIKMANKASLHVIDSTGYVVNGDSMTTKDLAWIDNRAENSGGDEWNIASGNNRVTLVRHVINLSKFKGQTIQLAIADVSADGWGGAYFDELIVNYDSDPAFKVDAVTQTNTHGTFYYHYADRYINAADITIDSNGVKYVQDNVTDWASITDTSNMKQAYDFLVSYYALARNTSNGTSICSVYTGDDMKALIGTTYAGLSEDVQKLICDSTDYCHTSTGDDWYTTSTTLFTVGESIAYIASVNGLNVPTYASNSGYYHINTFNNVDAFPVALVAGVLIVAAIGTVIFLKKRKEQR